MKERKLYLMLGVAGALVLFLATVGGAYAQGPRPPLSDTEPPLRDPLTRFCEPRFFGTRGWEPRVQGWFSSGWTTVFDAVAEALGLNPIELFTELHGGSTVPEVAEAQDVELETVREAVESAQVQTRKQAIEQAVEEGRLDEDRAKWMIEGLEQGFMPHGKRLQGGGRPQRQHGGRGRGLGR